MKQSLQILFLLYQPKTISFASYITYTHIYYNDSEFQKMSDSIRVVCRLRPLNKIEIAHDGQECVSYTDKEINILVGGEQTKYSFAFDKIFGPNTAQVNVYKEVSIPIIKSVLSGFNGTVFAYGQTGGGKTWTMEGPNHHDVEFKGLIPRTIQGLFESISESDENLQFVIKSSYVEIYNEKLFDLLDPSKARLEIKEDKTKGVFIQNCTEISVSSSEQMLRTMDTGSKNRKVAFTGMNERSSRSHSLFIIHLYQKNTKKDSTKQSKLYFVDLAGSQKVGKTGVQGQQLEEAKNINKSLSALGNVINALTSDKKQHVPYRDSKLTRILQESLGGNSRTTLIINCSMCSYNDKETLSTLRFGYRAKSIKNKPKMNEQKSVKQLLILLDAANKTIQQLRGQLKMPLSPLQSSSLEQEPSQKDLLIASLQSQLQSFKADEQERSEEMETRIKQLLLELSREKEDKEMKVQKWGGIFGKLSEYILRINKYVKRSYVDLEYCLNDLLLMGEEKVERMEKPEKNTTIQTIKLTLQGFQQYQNFYRNELQSTLHELLAQEQQDITQQEQQIKTNYLTPDKRKSKYALSQPILFQKQTQTNQEFQQFGPTTENDNVSCILISDPSQQNDPSKNKSSSNIYEENNSSDKVSQSSLSEFQTILESLETKESHRMLIEDMNASLKELRKENDELVKKIGKILEDRENSLIKVEEKYEERMLELEQRVHQYKNIMMQKDVELTKYFQTNEKLKKSLTEQKVISDRYKKVIDSNANMKVYHEMQERVRSLANERQKIFNEMYGLREQLDECEITIKEKEEHIQSLKSVMKELNQGAAQGGGNWRSKEDIERNYNVEVYGTETPNVVQTVKGGGGKQAKRSALRKKTQGISLPAQKSQSQSQNPSQTQNQQQKKQYIPFFKSFFN